MRWIVLGVLVIMAPTPQDRKLPKVLFLTHSAGFQHSVVKRPKADVLSHSEKKLVEAAKGRFEVVATQDCGTITKERLAGFSAVVFYTTGELAIDKDALIEFVKGGGGFVGIHCATDTLYKHAPYGEMIGGYFDGHPWHQKVRVRVEDRRHPATAHLGDAFEITDEIYQFRNWERKNVHVLLSIDPASVDLKANGVHRTDSDFAVSWTSSLGNGRVFYTSLGHREEVWQDPRFLNHLMSGIEWTFGARAPVDDEGFEVLFNAENTTGWTQAGPGGFKIENGVATSHGGMGLWYYDRRSFRNFILKLDFKQAEVGTNSGVYVRFPRVDGDPWIPVKEGYEIQIGGDKPSKNTTGAIYDFKAADEIPLKPAGEWNDCEITCIGQSYYVRLNGRLINTYFGSRSLSGMIGMQNHDDKSVIQFRNVRVKDLPDHVEAYHVLFDGREPKGWKMAGPGEFEFKDGALTSRGGMGLFWHELELGDFTLMLDWKVGRKKDNSGIFVRFPDPGNDPWVAVNKGYEIQICDVDPPKHRTGSLYSLKDSTHIPTKAVGEWNHYEITAVGQHYWIRINGELVNEFAGDRLLRGRIGLQNHDAEAAVSFRDVRVISHKSTKKGY